MWEPVSVSACRGFEVETGIMIARENYFSENWRTQEKIMKGWCGFNDD